MFQRADTGFCKMEGWGRGEGRGGGTEGEGGRTLADRVM